MAILLLSGNPGAVKPASGQKRRTRSAACSSCCTSLSRASASCASCSAAFASACSCVTCDPLCAASRASLALSSCTTCHWHQPIVFISWTASFIRLFSPGRLPAQSAGALQLHWTPPAKTSAPSLRPALPWHPAVTQQTASLHHLPSLCCSVVFAWRDICSSHRCPIHESTCLHCRGPSPLECCRGFLLRCQLPYGRLRPVLSLLKGCLQSRLVVFECAHILIQVRRLRLRQ